MFMTPLIAQSSNSTLIVAATVNTVDFFTLPFLENNGNITWMFEIHLYPSPHTTSATCL
jgi:hypothetical protein